MARYYNVNWQPALAAIDHDDEKGLLELLVKNPELIIHYTPENGQLIDYAKRRQKFLCIRILHDYYANGEDWCSAYLAIKRHDSSHLEKLLRYNHDISFMRDGNGATLRDIAEIHKSMKCLETIDYVHCLAQEWDRAVFCIQNGDSEQLQWVLENYPELVEHKSRNGTLQSIALQMGNYVCSNVCTELYNQRRVDEKVYDVARYIEPEKKVNSKGDEKADGTNIQNGSKSPDGHDYRITSLKTAIFEGKENYVKDLLKKKPDYLFCSKNFEDLFLTAKKYHRTDLITYLKSTKNKEKDFSALKRAISKEDEQVIETMLENHPEYIHLLDDEDIMGITNKKICDILKIPFTKASDKNNNSTKKPVTINKTKVEKQLPKNHVEKVSSKLERISNISKQNSQKNSGLCEFSLGMNGNAKNKKNKSSSKDSTYVHCNGFHEGSKNELQKNSKLIEDSTDNKFDTESKEALSVQHIYVLKGDLKYLKSSVNDRNINDQTGANRRTILHEAIIRNDENIINFLLSKNPDVNLADNLKESPIHAAVKNQNKNVISALIKRGCLVNVMNSKMQTPLHLTLEKKNSILSSILINAGADVNARNQNGKTPIHLAVEHDQNLKLMLQKGGDPLIPCDDFLQTPLHRAVILGKEDFVTELLLAGGIDKINVKDEKDRTPLHYATFHSHEQIVKILVTYKADISAVDKDGNTPAHLAVLSCAPKCLVILVNNNVNVGARNNAGTTVVDMKPNPSASTKVNIQGVFFCFTPL